MLIGLVRDSVLKCFCHTCSVNSAITGRNLYKKPLSKKINKKQPRCKQPKKARRHHATEIRAEEKSRGGMSYEVIMSDAVTERAPSLPTSAATSPTSPTGNKGPITHQVINEKLEQAQLRRKSFEAWRAASVNDRMNRLDEAAKKRHSQHEEFSNLTMVQLENKLDASSANRELHLDAVKAKAAKHLQNVDLVRNNKDEQLDKLKEDIEVKLSTAQENRDDHFRTLMAKLHAHEANIQRVRESNEIATLELSERINMKLELANENRMAEMERKLASLRQHFLRCEEVKEAKNKRAEGEEDKAQTKMLIEECEAVIEQLKEDEAHKDTPDGRLN